MISYSIYLVDDDQMLREGVTMALERDYQVKAFSTADTAIEAIKHSPRTWFCSISLCQG